MYANGQWWAADERGAREKVCPKAEYSMYVIAVTPPCSCIPPGFRIDLKVGAAFRDALHNFYKPRCKNKVARTKATEQDMSFGGGGP
jgi:hypothetical protein